MPPIRERERRGAHVGNAVCVALSRAITLAAIAVLNGDAAVATGELEHRRGGWVVLGACRWLAGGASGLW